MAGRAAKWCGAALAAVGLAFGIAQGAMAQAPGRTPSPPGARVYFVDLRDGAHIGQKVTLHFGLSNMGIAPAGVEKEGTGHHHLIIDAPLPPLDLPIPNDPQHLHFGAGQTEAEISLSPGPHTLQLLLGDRNHLPHDPPVASDVIHVVVMDEAEAASPAAAAPGAQSGRKPPPPDAKVYFISPRNGEVVYPNTVVRFGLTGMGIAPAGDAKAATGHHHLLVDAPLPPLDLPIPNDPQHLHFGAGQTETKLSLSPGPHTLQLILGDENHLSFDPPLISDQIRVIASASAAPPPPARRRPGPRRAASPPPPPPPPPPPHRRQWRPHYYPTYRQDDYF